MLRGNRRTVLTVLAIVLGALAAGFAASIALAGCSEEPSTPPTTPPATTADPSPTPTPTPTPTPDAATPPQRPDLTTVDAATAEALATYFLQLYPYVYATGDLTAWRELSHPECIFCASVITNVEQMLADGQHWQGGETTIDSVETVAALTEAFNIAVALTEAPSERIDPNGKTTETSAGGSNVIHLVVTADGGDWLVREAEVD